jgi:gamma-glutamyltranspeptidase/glutathione hydrolase
MTTIATPSALRRQAPSRALVAAFALSVVACGPGKAPAPPKAAPLDPPGPSGTHFGVSTENEEATRAALAVLSEGGDAVDAAAAATFVLGVATPTACGIGGGGFAVVWRAKEKKAYVLDFRERAPKGIVPEALDARPPKPEERGRFVGVPGEVAGVNALVAKFGKRTFAQALGPAIAVAERGFVMTPHVRHVLVDHAAALDALAPAFAREIGGAAGPLPVGARAPRPALAKTLRLLKDHGARAFYEGAVAEQIVASARAAGSTMTLEDLKSYEPVYREPLRLKLGDKEVLTMPPPSAGGLMLLEALKTDALLRKKSGKGLDESPLGSAAYVHRMAETMRGALDDRLRFVGDPGFVKVDVDALLGDARLEKRIALFDPMKTHAPAELRVDEKGTSHLSVVDAEGNAVALTTTVNDAFGAVLLAGETGILLNDELDDFAKTNAPYDATLPAPNVPRPGARPTSSMTPTIVLANDLPIAVLGGSGGTRIATSVTAVAVAHLVFGQGPDEALAAPRFHVFGRDLLLEDTFPIDARQDLEKRGESIKVGEAMNAVQIVTVDRASTPPRFRVAADPRKGGLALAR